MVYFDAHEMRAGDIANKKMLTREVNAAVEGAFEAGATEIVVNDDHHAGSNLFLEEMNPELQFILGKKTTLLEGIDDSFDAMFFIAQHAMINMHDGVLNHTFSAVGVNRIWINEQPMGEMGLRAAIGGYYGVPTILVTGDTAVAQEARDMFGDVETVAVKETISRYCAKSLHPAKARGLIKEGAKRAVGRISDFEPYTVKAPIRVKIEYTFSDAALVCANKIPGVKRMDERTVIYTGEDLMETMNIIHLAMAQQTKPTSIIDHAVTTM